MDAKNLGKKNCFVHCKIFELKLWRIEEEEGKEEETLLLNQAYALVVSELLYFPVATTVVLIKSAYAIAAEKRVINNLAKQRKMWQNNWLPRWRSYFDVEEIKTVIEMSFFVSFFIFFFGGHYPPTPCFFPTIKGYFSFLWEKKWLTINTNVEGDKVRVSNLSSLCDK